MRLLGLDIELDPEEGAWLVHQQSYIYAFLQEMFDPECRKDWRAPGEPESFSLLSNTILANAQKARVKCIHHFKQAKIHSSMPLYLAC